MIDGMLHPSAPSLIRPFTLYRWHPADPRRWISDNDTQETLKRHD